MTARQRERAKSLALAVVIVAFFVYVGGWKPTAMIAAVLVAVWLFGYQLPLARMAKQAKRRL